MRREREKVKSKGLFSIETCAFVAKDDIAVVFRLARKMLYAARDDQCEEEKKK